MHTHIHKHINSKKHSGKHSGKHSRKHSRKHSKTRSRTKPKTKNKHKLKHYSHGRHNHKYFIIKCDVNQTSKLNTRLLEAHLEKLSIQRDNAMNTFIRNIDTYIKIKKMTKDEFCNLVGKIKLPALVSPSSIKADIFFYDDNTTFLNNPFYNYKKYLANVLNINYYNLLNKDVIYKNLYTINPELATKYFIEVFNLKELDKYTFLNTPPIHYILRPTRGWGGADILYIHNEKQLQNSIKYYEKQKDKIKGQPYDDNVVASRYITNITTFKCRKYHLRMYYLVSVINGVLNTFLAPVGRILTAKEQYDLNTPFTREKHDTHVKSTDADYNFPDDFNSRNLSIEITDSDKAKLYDKIKAIGSGLTYIISKSVENKSNRDKNLLYPDQKNGYALYGLDILVRHGLEPVIIECNNNVGYTTKLPEKMQELSKQIYGWINEVVLEPLFTPGGNAMHARKHPSYIST